MSDPKMTFHVETVRLDAHGSLARCKAAQITLDTYLAGNPNAFNPAELLLAALSACIVKGVDSHWEKNLENFLSRRRSGRHRFLPSGGVRGQARIDRLRPVSGRT